MYGTGNSLPSSPCSRTTPITCSCAAIYILNVFLAITGRNTGGGMRYSLIFSKSFSLFCLPSEFLLKFEPNQWQQRLHSPCKVRYKTTQVIYLTEQLLDIFLAHQFSNLPNGLNFLRSICMPYSCPINPKNLPDVTLSYPIPRKRERSLHTCAQDVQITRTVAHSKVLFFSNSFIIGLAILEKSFMNRR
jgi:hypothetical protein